MLPFSGRGDESFNLLNFPVIMKSMQYDDEPDKVDKMQPQIMQEFADAVITAREGRCFFVTRAGFIGLGPEVAQEGDSVAILLGGDTCYVLREEESGFYFWRVH